MAPEAGAQRGCSTAPGHTAQPHQEPWPQGPTPRAAVTLPAEATPSRCLAGSLLYDVFSSQKVAQKSWSQTARIRFHREGGLARAVVSILFFILLSLRAGAGVGDQKGRFPGEEGRLLALARDG